MTPVEALLLGIIQGLTEFLPISSSGHLQLSQALFGFKDLHQYIGFDIICHLGTLLSIFVVFHQEIKEAFFQNRTRLYQIILATLPLFPLVLLLKPIKSLFNQPELLGFFFLLTAIILYAGIKLGYTKSEEKMRQNRWTDPLFIGLFQALAILPGVSRSGSTISAARMIGWTPQEAVTFSFLMAIPAILGATVIESAQWLKNPPTVHVSYFSYFLGFTASFIFGYFALQLLKNLAAKHKFMYFVWYCLLLGIGTLYYFNR